MENIERETITPKSESDWLAMRAKDLTSTEISALFGLNPRLTAFELWHYKKSGETRTIEESERMKWGKRLEPVVALGVAQDNGWDVEPFKDYMRVPSLRIGSSFDYRMKDSSAIVEVKTVDRMFLKDWFNKDGEIEAPFYIELQAHHQMLVSGIENVYIAALFGGNEAKVLHRTYNPQIGQMILDKCAEFWKRIDDGKCYEPNYEDDSDFIKQLYAKTTAGKSFEAFDDSDLKTWSAELVEVRKQTSFLKKQEDAIKAQILEKIKDSEIAKGNGWSITAKTQHRDSYTVKESDSRVIRVKIDGEE